jgi:hypothetical protein
MSTSRIGSCLLATSAMLLILAGLLASSAMAAATLGERVLDPRLSLIGGCLEEDLDPVEDPGCPNTPPAGKHPSSFLAFPRAVATDFDGNIFVANWGKNLDGSEGRIDIFSSGGRYISEIPQGVVESPEALAVDSTGTLYAWSEHGTPGHEHGQLFRFKPCAPYDPAAGEIDYCESPSIVNLEGPVCEPFCGRNNGFKGLAINPENDHLFTTAGEAMVEYSSAAEGNEEVRSVKHASSSITGAGHGIALDSVRHRLYIEEGQAIGIYDLAEGLPAQEEYEKIGSIEASVVPQKQFGTTISLAVDEGTGHLYAYDSENTHLWEFDEEGNYLATVEFPLQSLYGTEIAIDNGPSSPNGKLGEEVGRGRYLYVPSHPRGTPGHLFAFAAAAAAAPEVKSVHAGNLGEDEAELQATVNPGNLDTTYSFELKPEGAPEWATVGEGTLPAGNLDAEASAAVTGLAPGSHYRFRVLASNEEGSDEAEGSFATYPGQTNEPSPCANALLRTGGSALLPDCRAYELVTPPDTDARSPLGALGEGGGFTTRQVSPAGDKVPFRISGGTLAGFNATGSLLGDTYLATRTPSGWSTSLTGPTGVETTSAGPGTTSPDQDYTFFAATGSGPTVLEGNATFYVRFPDGHSELLGQGSLGVEPQATGHLISEDGGHIIFNSGRGGGGHVAVQLEPDAAPTGTAAIYDRTPDGVTHVVSLRPGDIPFGAHEGTLYEGASFDGVGVAFTANGILYLRHNDEITYEGVPQALSGHQVTCTAGSLAGGSAEYEWLRDGTPIPSANSATYTPVAADAGTELQCVVTAQNAEGATIAASDPLLVDRAHNGGPAPRGTTPTISGEASAGQTLTCNPGSWSANPSLSYQWYRNGSEITGATANTYEVGAADEGTIIQCGVIATANGATVLGFSAEAEAPSPPSGPAPTLLNLTHSGEAPQFGDELECKAGSWQGEPSFSYRWLRNGAPIGATASTYTVAAADEGTALQCEESGANAVGTDVTVSTAQAVAPLASSELPAGSLQVNGLFAVGNTLECETGSWQGGPSFSYQWLRDGAPIGGATASSYTLTAEDRETVVECQVTAENAAGTVLALAGSFVNQRPSAQSTVSRLDAQFAGVAEGGTRLFYVEGGDLWRFDAEGETTTRFSETGNAVPTYLSADGSTAYFISKKAIAGSGSNPEGAKPKVLQQNLYRSQEGQVSFIGTVTERDVVGGDGAEQGSDGLGLWLSAVGPTPSGLGQVPARSTPDGSVLLFKSRAPLTDYDSEGHAEIYRYDSAANQLLCLSCNPIGSAAHSDATLQSPKVASNLVWPENLRADGRRAFFESSESLVARDGDGLQDVYEWEDQGVGSCSQPGGCLYLISSPQSGSDEYLWAVSASGDDVFFRSSGLLVGADRDETASIYDARVGGGFAEGQVRSECLGEACQPAAKAPNDATPASASFQGAGNVKEEKAGAHKKKHRHKKKHHAKKHRKQANGKRRAAR